MQIFNETAIFNEDEDYAYHLQSNSIIFILLENFPKEFELINYSTYVPPLLTNPSPSKSDLSYLGFFDNPSEIFLEINDESTKFASQ